MTFQVRKRDGRILISRSETCQGCGAIYAIERDISDLTVETAFVCLGHPDPTPLASCWFCDPGRYAGPRTPTEQTRAATQATRRPPGANDGRIALTDLGVREAERRRERDDVIGADEV